MPQSKMYKLIAITGILFFGLSASAQLHIDNATFFIQPGATVSVQGDLTSNVNIQGTGKVLLNGSANQNVNMNGFSIPNLEMNNTANATLTGNALVDGDLLFTNGRILLANFNLSMAAAPAGTITGATNARYVVTGGTGRLIKTGLVGATAFTYPIGNTTATYNPVTISNPAPGVADNIGARALAQAYTNGLAGPAFVKEVVDASWDITESVAGGSNLSLNASWYLTDELPGFNRNKAGISYYITTPGPTLGWDLLNSQTGVAAGANPYSYTRSLITSLGAFAVGTRPVLSPLLVSPKVILQGAIPITAGVMSDKLRTIAVPASGTTDATHGLIPILDPYTGLSSYTHSGSGGLETITPGAFGVFSVTNSDAIVDWVFVSLHDGVSGTVISTRAALLQRDGDIVETDGVSSLNMAGNAVGSYFISVRHRNHLGIRTPATISLAKTTTTNYNFTTAQTQAYKNLAITTNEPMKNLGGGFFAMWGGNADGNNTVRTTGLAGNNDYLALISAMGNNPAAIINFVYNRADMDMNGIIRATGLVGNNDYLFLIGVLDNNPTKIFTQHL